MNNKKVQEKLCVEPIIDPQEAMQYAISYEEGVNRQISMGIEMAESSKVAMDSELVCAVERVNKRKWFLCGVGNTTTDHKNNCPATNQEFCDIIGHLEKCCNEKFLGRKKQRIQNRRRWMSRVNYVSEESDR